MRQNLEGIVATCMNEASAAAENVCRIHQTYEASKEARVQGLGVHSACLCRTEHGPTLVFANHKPAPAGTVDV